MAGINIYKELQEKIWQIASKEGLLEEEVSVTGRALTVEEAIGNPDRQDFPLIKGKEKLLKAKFKGAIGQAFTDMPGSFAGRLAEIITRPLKTNFDKAVFIATLNSVLRYLDLIEGTIHCKDNEPEECAKSLINYLKENHGNPQIALIGFQPSFLEQLASNFSLRVLDLDYDRIGTHKFGVLIEDGEKNREEVLNWCDLILATGSTVANGTITSFLNRNKPVVFYGTTVAGAAYLLGLNRYCKNAK